MNDNEYTPPKVWTWDSESGGKWAGVNRPIAGPTHEKVLPVGDAPLQLYSLGTPNGVKITVMLEELLAMGKTDAAYDLHIIKIVDGEQFGSDFVTLNPNSKIPVLLDRSKSPAQSVFESCAILFYLAEKFSALLPEDVANRTECLSWLFWAGEQRVLPWRWLRPFLPLRTLPNGIPDQSLCHGNQASTGCAGSSPGRA